jgi:hypothetical protein
MQSEPQIKFNNTFKNKLDNQFYSIVKPTPVSSPYLISFNEKVWSELLGQEDISKRQDLAEYLSGNKLFNGSEPTAALYAGYQFGYLTPQLGDGRAILLGQVTDKESQLWDLQLKGSGRTPYSRMGDGRAVLRSTIREYLGAEAMHYLGIPTTRSLSIVGTDDPVYREKVETGAMLIRVAPSHVRFGNFDIFNDREQYHLVKRLADHVIQEHFPTLTGEDRYIEFFRIIVQRTAKLMAQWQAVGFAHGVMNTDNFSILGLTIDYGPFGFLDAYDPEYVCNHSDYGGRYAFDAQPSIGKWNLKRLEEALSTLLKRDGIVNEMYDRVYENEYNELMAKKLVLDTPNRELVNELLAIMQRNSIDYTNMFRALGNLSHGNSSSDNMMSDEQFVSRFFGSNTTCQIERMSKWLQSYREELKKQGVDVTDNTQLQSLQIKMNKTNPKYIMRNYMLQEAIEQAQKKNFSEVERLLNILRRPYDEQPENEKYAADAPTWAKQIQISCSS